MAFSNAVTPPISGSRSGRVSRLLDWTATAVISGLPTILLAIVFRRHLIRGLTEGSVKK